MVVIRTAFIHAKHVWPVQDAEHAIRRQHRSARYMQLCEAMRPAGLTHHGSKRTGMPARRAAIATMAASVSTRVNKMRFGVRESLLLLTAASSLALGALLAGLHSSDTGTRGSARCEVKGTGLLAAALATTAVGLVA